MRTVSEKYANSSNHYMADIDFFSTQTITVPISFRLLAIALLSLSHWVDTWWANGDVSPSQMAVVDRLDLKISDYIKSKAI